MNYEMKNKLEGLGGGNAQKNYDDASTSLFRGTSCVGEPQVNLLSLSQGCITLYVSGKCP